MKGNRKHLEAAGALMEKALNSKKPLPESSSPVAESFKDTTKRFDDLPDYKKREFEKLFPSKLKPKKFGYVWWLVDSDDVKVKGPYGSKQIAEEDNHEG